MTLYRPQQRSELPLDAAWFAIGRRNYGVWHYRDCDDTCWTFKVERIEKRADGWYRVELTTERDEDEINVIVKALPHLPGVPCRLALLTMLMEISV